LPSFASLSLSYASLEKFLLKGGSIFLLDSLPIDSEDTLTLSEIKNWRPLLALITEKKKRQTKQFLSTPNDTKFNRKYH